MGKGFKKAISAARRTVRANERSGGMCGPGNGAAQDELQSKGLNDFSSTLGTLDSMKSVAGIEAGSKFLGPAGAAVSAANTMVNYEPHATGEKSTGMGAPPPEGINIAPRLRTSTVKVVPPSCMTTT